MKNEEEMNEAGDSSPPGRSEELSTAVQEGFRADLNHKLRTPLNAIIGFAELLALRPANKRDGADVQQILKSAHELLRIIERELAEPDDRLPEKPRAITAIPHVCDILYVEDDMVNFTLVERILEFRPGVNLMHAEQGELGLQLAEAHQPKMILLDLNLPDMHGAEVLRRLQERSETAQIPVVVLSADATSSQIERLLSAGAKNYLTKPFDIDPFLAVIDEFVAVPSVTDAGLKVVG